MNLKKSLLILSISIFTSQLLAEDFEIPEESIEVVESDKVKSNYDKEDLRYKTLSDLGEEEVDITIKTNNNNNNNKLSTADFLDGNDEDQQVEEPDFIKKEKEKPKFKPKRYQNVRFKKNYEWYSIISHKKKDFKAYINHLGLPEEAIRNMFGKIDSTKAIKLNAFAYDYAKHDASIAENYYRLFNHKMGFFDGKLRYADYLIRTGRPQEVKKILKRRDCSANVKYNAKCYYYLGVADYLLTGNNRNSSLHMAKSWIKKAKLIYNKK